jgi:hypothetical protein
MNVLVNVDEWIATWVKESATETTKQTVEIAWDQTQQYVKQCRREFKKSGLIIIDFAKVNYLLEKDLYTFRNTVNQTYKDVVKEFKHTELEKIQQSGYTDQEIIAKYLNDTSMSFAKTIAPQLTSELNWILDESQADWTQPFFIRNVINNESLLRRCLDEKLNFWFVDTGYTNFLSEKKKLWHRLIKNHIHHDGEMREYPDDRLHLLSNFPEKWRRKGSTILVIESSPGHYLMRGTTLEAWRESIEQGIRAETDRPIEFRHKNTDRKTRQSVYELLKESKEYYCVVSDSSAAAVEALWTGTPVVTLEQHITNPVSRQRLDQLHNLYRGDLDAWFRMLSYSQFTFEELCDGTAVSIVKEYSNV